MSEKTYEYIIRIEHGACVDGFGFEILDEEQGGKEIVRCRNCEHYYEKSEEDLVFCLNRSFLGGANYAETEPHGFCAWGKRREDA